MVEPNHNKSTFSVGPIGHSVPKLGCSSHSVRASAQLPPPPEKSPAPPRAKWFTGEERSRGAVLKGPCAATSRARLVGRRRSRVLPSSHVRDGDGVPARCPLNSGCLRASPVHSLVASESSDCLGGLLRCPPSLVSAIPLEISRLRFWILLLLSASEPVQIRLITVTNSGALEVRNTIVQHRTKRHRNKLRTY